MRWGPRLKLIGHGGAPDRQSNGPKAMFTTCANMVTLCAYYYYYSYYYSDYYDYY